MKKTVIIVCMMFSAITSAHEESISTQAMIHQETIQCDKNEGCEVVCRQPGDRWNSYLKTEGNIEVTYFLNSGVRQLKADMGDGKYTILDTHPELQSCRITGVR